MTLPTGERYIFTRGQQGDLVAAYTPSGQPGVAWQSLGAPQGVTLTGSVTALWDGKGMLVGALSSNGAFWLRAGPAGMLGEWTSLGSPTATTFQGTPVALTTPTANGVMRQALAVGRDGRLYEAAWSVGSGVGSQGGAAGWSGWALAPLSGSVGALQGSLSLVAGQNTAQAGDSYLLALGAGGRLWTLHRAPKSATWDARAISLPDASGVYRTLSAAFVPAAAGGSARPPTLQVYLADSSASGTSSAVGAASQSASATDAGGERALFGAIPLDGTSGAGAVTWAPIGAASAPVTPVASAALGSSAALSLGPGQSALLAAQGDAVTLLGETASVRLLAPDTTPSAASAASAQRLVIGVVPGPAAFSDAFGGSALDPRWLMTTFASTADGLAPAPSAGSATQAAQVARGALTLSTSATSSATPSATPSTAGPSGAATPRPGGMVAALQGASGKDGSVTARVTPGAGWASGATAAGQKQAGILLALDDWNRVALALRGDDTVALCVTAGTDEPQCSVTFLPPDAASSQSVSLRLTTLGATLTGLVSADGQHWTQVGAWTLAWLPGPGAISGPYAPPASAINGAAPNAGASVWPGFTSAGVFVADAGASQASPAPGARFSAQFSAFTVDAGA